MNTLKALGIVGGSKTALTVAAEVSQESVEGVVAAGVKGGFGQALAMGATALGLTALFAAALKAAIDFNADNEKGFGKDAGANERLDAAAARGGGSRSALDEAYAAYAEAHNAYVQAQQAADSDLLNDDLQANADAALDAMMAAQSTFDALDGSAEYLSEMLNESKWKVDENGHSYEDTGFSVENSEWKLPPGISEDGDELKANIGADDGSGAQIHQEVQEQLDGQDPDLVDIAPHEAAGQEVHDQLQTQLDAAGPLKLKAEIDPEGVPENANGGIYPGKPFLSWVAEDGPEAIIPLGSKRRQRGLQLWAEAGRQLGIMNNADGGIYGNASAAMGGMMSDNRSYNDSINFTVQSMMLANNLDVDALRRMIISAGASLRHGRGR